MTRQETQWTMRFILGQITKKNTKHSSFIATKLSNHKEGSRAIWGNSQKFHIQ